MILECDLVKNIKLISKKWISFVFCLLFENEKMYFNELKDSISDRSSGTISASALSQLLKDLENNNIIKRIFDEFSHPPRSVYSLTEKGKELRFIFALLKEWGVKWSDANEKSNNCCIVQYLPEIKINLTQVSNKN